MTMKIATIEHIDTALQRTLNNRDIEVSLMHSRRHAFRPGDDKRFGALAMVSLSHPLTYMHPVHLNMMQTAQLTMSVAHNGGMELRIWDTENDDGPTVESMYLFEFDDTEIPITTWLQQKGYVVAFSEWCLDTFGGETGCLDELDTYDGYEWAETHSSPNRIANNVDESYSSVMAHPDLVKAIAPPRHYSRSILLSSDNDGLVVSCPADENDVEMERIRFVLRVWRNFGYIYTGE